MLLPEELITGSYVSLLKFEDYVFELMKQPRNIDLKAARLEWDAYVHRHAYERWRDQGK